MASRSAVQAFERGVRASKADRNQAQATALHPEAQVSGNQKLRASRFDFESYRCFDILRCCSLKACSSEETEEIKLTGGCGLRYN